MQLSFHQWLLAFRRHWILSVLSFLTVVAASVAVVLVAPRTYMSEAKLMLRIGRESISVDPTASSVGDTLALHHTRENEIQSAVGVMQSREILERVVDELGEEVVLSGKLAGPKREPSWAKKMVSKAKGVVANIDPVPAHERAVRSLVQQLFIGSTAESSVVKIAYSTDSPEVAQKVVASWVENYIVQHTKANHTDGSLEFFVKQGDLLRERLGRAREMLQTAKDSSQLVTVAGQQQLLETQLAKVRDELLDAETKHAALESRIVAYGEILSESETMITSEVIDRSNEGRNLMRDRLFELEVLEKQMESRFSTDHPKLVTIREQLAEAQAIVDQQREMRPEVTQAVNPAYQRMSENQLIDRAELAGLMQRREKLQEKHQSLVKEMKALNESERGIMSLQNEVKILEGRFADHAVQMEQARMEQVLADEQITSVAIVQPASLQLRPVSPNKPLCAVVGFLAATAIALGLPLCIETRRTLAAEKEQNAWDFAKREKELSGEEQNHEGQRAASTLNEPVESASY